MVYGSKSRLAALAALACVVFNHAHADEISPQSEYTRRIKSYDSVQPHGDSPFGEQVNLYTGDLSFRHADIVLEGTGPTISLVRTTATPMNSEYRSSPHAFGNWMLSVPRIETLIQSDWSHPPGTPGNQWIIAGYGDPDRFSRCSRFDRPMYLGPFPESWNGMDLYTEDGRQQSVLKRHAGNTMQPTMTNSQGNPIAFPAVTQAHWQVGCLANTSNGEVGEAFFVVSPDGTKYWFDYLESAGANTVFGIEMGTMLRQRRMLAIMYVSRIEDRFGNSLSYHYSDNKLASITASDGRSVSITWRSDAPLIESITAMPAAAAPRTWRYEYRNITASMAELSSVVLPDNTRWSFSGVPVPSTSPPIPEFTECGTRTYTNNNGVATTASITHPSGLVGSFGIGSVVHGRSYVMGGCRRPQPPHEEFEPYEDIPALFRSRTLGQR